MNIQGKHYRTVWMENNTIKIINQNLLPHSFEILDLNNTDAVADAIKTMKVRGAGAIGATGAFGLAQAINKFESGDFNSFLDANYNQLLSTRPTAHDLKDGLEYIKNGINELRDFSKIKVKAMESCQKYADKGAENCKKIGEHVEKMINNGFRILTHCNAGWLAFVDWGTALSPIYLAKRKGKEIFVFVDETRPRCQGSNLTAFELLEEQIPHVIIADNAAGYYMRKGEVDLVITGADRIAANGDVVNKIGTYEKAVLAKENSIPFYVTAPSSTIDFNAKSGDDIAIEERDEEEVLYAKGWSDNNKLERVRISPANSKARNPAFDVTPNKYVDLIITEKGIFSPDKLKK